jgi:hypothetical protein
MAAVRRLFRAPGATLVSVVSLALGMGIAAGLLAARRSIESPSLGVGHPATLFALSRSFAGSANDVPFFSMPEFEELRSASAGTPRLAAFYNGTAIVKVNQEVTRAAVALVSPDYFTVMGRCARCSLFASTHGARWRSAPWGWRAW